MAWRAARAFRRPGKGGDMGQVWKNAKMRFLLLAAFFMLAAGGALCQGMGAAHAETTVYVTASGSKYHTHKCGSGNYYPATLSEALARGLTPCSKCYGGGSGGSEGYSGGSEDDSGSGWQEEEPDPMEISRTSLLLVKGQSEVLEVYPETGASWVSSDPGVASVSAGGKVTAKKKGKAVVTASAGGQSVSCAVTVEAPKLNKTSLRLELGQTKQLKLSGCRHSVKWSSGNSGVATASKGRVKAKKPGTAYIRAKVHGKTFKCKVTVKKPAIQKVSLPKKSVLMGYEKTVQMKAGAKPAKAMQYYRVQAKSSKPSIVSASVWGQNMISLNSHEKSGKAEVTVSIGKKKAKCQVEVIPSVITSLSIARSLSLKPDESRYILYNVEPYEASRYYEGKWESRDKSVATVTGYGDSARIDAVGEGETDVILTLGTKTASCHVVVAKPAITGLTLSQTTMELAPDGSGYLYNSVEPYDAADYYEGKWESKDESVATVTGYGDYARVDAAGEGETDVILTLGAKSVACHVVVAKPAITGLTLSQTTMELTLGESGYLYDSVEPYVAANYYEGKWESKNESVAAVTGYNDYARVDAAGEGETDVILTLGTKSVACHVVVRAE